MQYVSQVERTTSTHEGPAENAQLLLASYHTVHPRIYIYSSIQNYKIMELLQLCACLNIRLVGCNILD